MSFFDVLFIVLYAACGIAAADYVAMRYGALWGIVAFVLGFFAARLLILLIVNRLGRTRSSGGHVADRSPDSKDAPK